MIYTHHSATDEDACDAALGLKSRFAEPAWPLPNMKRVEEKDFWNHAASWSWSAEGYGGHFKIGDEWATVRIFYAGHSRLIDGGYAVAVFRGYQEERVEYYEWRACDHVFASKNVGRCLNRYTCEKCGKSYEIDSSD